MKNSTLMKLLECLHIRDYNLLVGEHGFKMDFSQVGSQNSRNSIGKTTEKKSKISSYLMLVLLFLFTNFLFAQKQPACNLRGILESKRLRDGGQNFTINSDVVHAAPGTEYRWEFKSNNSQATFVTQNGQPNMTISPGNKNGEFNVKLTIINPSETRGASKTCSCTKSVSIGNVN